MSARLTPEQKRDRAMTEAELLEGVLKLARMYGWRVAHFRPCQTGRGWRTPVQADGAGFPDLVMVRGSRIIVAELKRELGPSTDAQVAWLLAFEDAGVAAYTWRPSGIPEIAEVLA